MTTFFYKKKQYILPSHFEELSSSQFIRISDLLYKGGNQLICYTKALWILTGFSRLKFRLINPDLVNRLLDHVKWIFDENKTVKQLLPKYKGFYGPVDNFDNLKMKELHFSEIYFRQIVTENDQPALDKFVAVLYRQAKFSYNKKLDPDGDLRVPFNANEIEYFSKKIERWPISIKHAIFLWYDSCRKELIKNNPLVFSAENSGFESQFDTGIYGLMRSLAGEKLGSLSNIEEMYVHTAMLELGLLREEEKYIEEKMAQS